MKDSLIYDNIFNRCIFGKATKEEMEYSIEYFTEIEQYEKCMVIKDLLEYEYYIDNPINDDLNKINEIIENHKIDLNELNKIGGNLINKIYEEEEEIPEDEIEDINNILDDIDDVSDDIIYNILESNKLRKEYLKSIYDDVSKTKSPELKNPKTKKLLEEFRYISIENIKNVINSIGD